MMIAIIQDKNDREQAHLLLHYAPIASLIGYFQIDLSFSFCSQRINRFESKKVLERAWTKRQAKRAILDLQEDAMQRLSVPILW